MSRMQTAKWPLVVAKQVIYLGRWSLFFLLDRIASISFKRKVSGGVAIIRLDYIGDFVLWLDSVGALLKNFKGHSITLIANSKWYELAKTQTYWDEIVPIDVAKFAKNPFYRFSVVRKISKTGFEVAVNPVYSRTALVADAVVRATEAKQRIGSVGDCSNVRQWEKRISNRWYTRLLEGDPRPMTELERNEEFVRAMGSPSFKAGLPQLQISGAFAKSIRIEEDYFVIAPGASWPGRQWSEENFARLIDKIGAHTGWLPVLCGSMTERHLCTMVAAACKRRSVNLAGRTSVVELVELVRGAKLAVGNESALVHISSAVRTPSVCIVGGGHFGRFLPYKYERTDLAEPPRVAFHGMTCFGCNWHCTQEHVEGQAVPCISKIEVGEVFELLEDYLN